MNRRLGFTPIVDGHHVIAEGGYGHARSLLLYQRWQLIMDGWVRPVTISDTRLNGPDSVICMVIVTGLMNNKVGQHLITLWCWILINWWSGLNLTPKLKIGVTLEPCHTRVDCKLCGFRCYEYLAKYSQEYLMPMKYRTKHWLWISMFSKHLCAIS